VAEDQGWEIRRRNVYQRLDDARLGASFDYEIVNDSRGPGMLEIKNVDAITFRSQWSETGGQLAAPDHIELQLQQQLEVSGYSWGAIVPLVGGNEAHVLLRERDHSIGQDMRRRAAEFWTSIELNEPPAPDFARDSEFIVKTLRRMSCPGEVLEADNDLEALLQSYREASEALKELEKHREAVKAEVLMLIGTASQVRAKAGHLACGETKPTLGTLITPDMVGTWVGGRAGFRQFRFYPAKEKP
jgi:predicted phage-related endonuclease